MTHSNKFEQRLLTKMCGCNKRSFKLREAKMHKTMSEKKFLHAFYIYKCLNSRWYHLTKSKPWKKTLRNTVPSVL